MKYAPGNGAYFYYGEQYIRESVYNEGRYIHYRYKQININQIIRTKESIYLKYQ